MTAKETKANKQAAAQQLADERAEARADEAREQRAEDRAAGAAQDAAHAKDKLACGLRTGPAAVLEFTVQPRHVHNWEGQ